MSQFKIAKDGIHGNFIGNLQGTASVATGLGSKGASGSVWGMTSATTQGWVNPKGGSEGAVKYDESQSLTDVQKEQARQNIDTLSSVITAPATLEWMAPYIQYTAQTLNDSQKAQARANIGALAGTHTHAGSDITSTVANATNAVNATSASHAAEIQWTGVTGRPSSLPANGGNADTVDTKHASDFATAAQGAKADSALQSHQTVTLASGTNNGTLKLTTSAGTTDNVAVKGLGSAAYSNTSAFATAAQGAKADSALQSHQSIKTLAGQTLTGTGTVGSTRQWTIKYSDGTSETVNLLMI